MGLLNIALFIAYIFYVAALSPSLYTSGAAAGFWYGERRIVAAWLGVLLQIVDLQTGGKSSTLWMFHGGDTLRQNQCRALSANIRLYQSSQPCLSCTQIQRYGGTIRRHNSSECAGHRHSANEMRDVGFTEQSLHIVQRVSRLFRCITRTLRRLAETYASKR